MLSALNPMLPKSRVGLLQRPEREKILTSLRKSEMVLVSAPHASGLSTMLADVADLEMDKCFVSTCYINGHELAALSPSQCFSSVLSRIGELVSGNWQPQECSDAPGFRRSLLGILRALPERLVLLMDDLQAAPAEWVEPWLGLLRGISHEQQFQPVWNKLVFLLGTHDLRHDYGQNFLTRYSLQPVSREAMVSWLAAQPGLAVSREACLALSAWSGGNPVLARGLLRYLPAVGRMQPADIAAAAVAWAQAEHLPNLDDAAQELIHEISAGGPLPIRRRSSEERLIARGCLRENNGQLVWVAPLVALLWKMKRPSQSSRANQPELLLDMQQMQVYHRGRPILLNPQEMRILFLLASQPSRFFSADAIYRGITDDDAELPFSANIRAQIARLRKKLPSPNYLQTRRNVGYAFEGSLPYEVKEG